MVASSAVVKRGDDAGSGGQRETGSAPRLAGDRGHRWMVGDARRRWPPPRPPGPFRTSASGHPLRGPPIPGVSFIL